MNENARTDISPTELWFNDRGLISRRLPGCSQRFFTDGRLDEAGSRRIDPSNW